MTDDTKAIIALRAFRHMMDTLPKTACPEAEYRAQVRAMQAALESVESPANGILQGLKEAVAHQRGEPINVKVHKVEVEESQ
jgi:hypothetical protein